MHFFRLLHRRKSPATRAEPTALPVEDAFRQMRTGMPETDSDTLWMFEERQFEEDLQGSGAILGLIGSHLAVQPGGVSQTSMRADVDDLISSLHRQYCQALDNPLGPVTGTVWESPTESSGSYMRGDSGLSADPYLPDGSHDSIEALLSGAQLLDHAFGPLNESDLGNLPESEPVPEILRLFAPPEYLASAFRSLAALPPALARREHHSLGIDSPLPMPEVTLTENSP